MKNFQMKTKALRAIRLFCACVLLLCAALPCACAQEVPELLEPVGVKMDTAEAYIGEISRIEVYDGRVIPYVEGLYFPVEGVVDEVHVIIGQQVSKGDVLVTLDQEAQTKQADGLRQQIAELEAAASYEEALEDIDRDIMKVELQALMDQKPRNEAAIALKKLEMESFELNCALETDLRELEISRLEEELALIEEQLGEKVLTAPFDGRIMFMANIDRTTYLSAYSPIIYMADDSRLTVETALIPQSILSGAHQMYALIGAEQYDITQIVMDEQEYMSKLLSGETLMSEFSIEGMGDSVHAGMYAAVCAEVDYAADALLVPGNAVYSDSTGDYVYLIEDGARVRRDVELGVKTDWLAQILGGLVEGDVVYVKE